jgi:hypothetical protein
VEVEREAVSAEGDALELHRPQEIPRGTGSSPHMTPTGASSMGGRGL